jgi:hypothetical protein
LGNGRRTVAVHVCLEEDLGSSIVEIVARLVVTELPRRPCGLLLQWGKLSIRPVDDSLHHTLPDEKIAAVEVAVNREPGSLTLCRAFPPVESGIREEIPRCGTLRCGPSRWARPERGGPGSQDAAVDGRQEFCRFPVDRRVTARVRTLDEREDHHRTFRRRKHNSATKAGKREDAFRGGGSRGLRDRVAPHELGITAPRWERLNKAVAVGRRTSPPDGFLPAPTLRRLDERHSKELQG